MKKQLLALVLFSAVIGTALVDAAPARTNVIIPRDKTYFLNRAHTFFEGLKAEHPNTIIIHSSAGTAPVKNIIATYENPKYNANKAAAGSQLETVEVGFKQGKSALPGSDEEIIIKKIQTFFNDLKKENPEFVNVRKSAGTRQLGTEFASFKNLAVSKKGKAGSSLDMISVEFAPSEKAKKGKLMGLIKAKRASRPTQAYQGPLTQQEVDELNNQQKGATKEALDADLAKREIINNQRSGNF
ncbi:MAG TPA: hypothetical protein VHO47_04620 [Candidatus Babeliales bacterium]|nr:hypothetical protein [Candidatus Babeliales bacterium]